MCPETGKDDAGGPSRSAADDLPAVYEFHVPSRLNILVLDGESPFATKVVRSLGSAGRWRIHVLAQVTSGQKPPLAWSRHVSSFHTVAAADDEECYLDRIRRVAQQTHTQVILPVTEATFLFCIRHRRELEAVARMPPLPVVESFVTAIDKGLLGSFMAKYGIPHPALRYPVDAGLSDLHYPLLVKPRRSSGGIGIRKVHSPAELRVELARREDWNGLCLQEYIEGPDMGCSVLARNGKIEAWTTQRGIRRPRPFAAFSELQIEACEPVLKVTERLIGALRWSGVAHVDFRVDARTHRPLVLEVNGRYWASLLASTRALVNFPDLAGRMAWGETVAASMQRPGRFVQPKAFCADLLRLRLRTLRRQWTGLTMILHDPLPELMTRMPRFPGIAQPLHGKRVPVSELMSG